MNMIRTLAGLFIVVSVLPISVLAYRFTGNIPFEYSEVSDELCINQLREIMLISYDLDYAYDRLSFIYQNKEFTLSEVNEKLILQPGTQIFLSAADRVYFARHDGLVYVVCERGRERSEKVLYKE